MSLVWGPCRSLNNWHRSGNPNASKDASHFRDRPTHHLPPTQCDSQGALSKSFKNTISLNGLFEPRIHDINIRVKLWRRILKWQTPLPFPTFGKGPLGWTQVSVTATHSSPLISPVSTSLLNVMTVGANVVQNSPVSLLQALTPKSRPLPRVTTLASSVFPLFLRL